MELKNVYGKEISLWPWQERAIKQILESGVESTAVVATPTGAGKTIVAYSIAERVLAEGGRVVMTAPLKAISNERFVELSRSPLAGVSPGIMTGDVTLNPSSRMLLVTTEVLANNPRLADGAYVIHDEVHYTVTHPDRARALVEALEASRRGIGAMLMSATLGGLEDVKGFASFVAKLTGKPPVVVFHGERPVELRILDKPVPSPDVRRAIVFVGLYRGASDVAYSVADTRDSEPSRLVAFESLLNEYAPVRTAYLSDWLISRGVAVYHGGLMPGEKLAVEEAFRQGIVDVVVGTTALAYGVNMPADMVLFTYEFLSGMNATVVNIHQMAGRAGRPGLSPVGYVGVLEGYADTEDIKAVKGMLAQTPRFYLRPLPLATRLFEALATNPAMTEEEASALEETENEYLAMRTWNEKPATVAEVFGGYVRLLRVSHYYAELVGGEDIAENVCLLAPIFVATIIPEVPEKLWDPLLRMVIWNRRGNKFIVDAMDLPARFYRGDGRSLYLIRQLRKWLKRLESVPHVDVHGMDNLDKWIERQDPLVQRLKRLAGEKDAVEGSGVEIPKQKGETNASP